MHFKRRTFAAALAAVLGLAATACGGGSGSAPAQGSGPSAAAGLPLSASASVAGLINWASTIAPDDTAEPLSTGTFQPPVDEMTEPTRLS